MRLLLAVFAMVMALSAQANIETHSFASPADEARYKQLIAELRCLVCQNQNLADSNAELAIDLRREVYEMIQRGDSNEQITTFMVNRYGDFVLYRPPFKATTAFLWVGPFLILLGGLVLLYMVIRKRKSAAEVDVGERSRARQLLDDQDSDEDKPAS